MYVGSTIDDSYSAKKEKKKTIDDSFFIRFYASIYTSSRFTWLTLICCISIFIPPNQQYFPNYCNHNIKVKGMKVIFVKASNVWLLRNESQRTLSKHIVTHQYNVGPKSWIQCWTKTICNFEKWTNHCKILYNHFTINR